MAEPEPLTYDSDRLIREWRARYANRRTVQWQMLDEATLLVRDAIARELEQERRETKTQRDWDLERREREAERTERLHASQIDRLRRELAEAKEKIASLSPRQTLMREERETIEDGTVVRLLAPTTPSYGDKSSPRPWMLGELEDVMYRLRVGGADEGTEVRFKRDSIEACIPFAEFALVPQKSTPEPRLPDPGRTPTRRIPLVTSTAFLVAAALTVAIVLGLWTVLT